ncbi:thermonuclease family protein [Candidatus Kaiserbacteria bacterium]|nr:thermonuclease family protein [Candidatus Kaiserbacteria bacterium]
MMRRLVATAILLATIAFVVIGASAPPEKAAAPAAAGAALPAQTQPGATLYPVARVVDGDTIVVYMNGKNVKVRLIGLDTPEIVDPRKPVQCFAKEASDKAKEMLTGKSVRLEQDPTQDTYDKYGRLLAYVFLPDGTNFEKYMIAEGYGHEYAYRIPHKYQAEFEAAEKQALETKKGLWADGVCAP